VALTDHEEELIVVFLNSLTGKYQGEKLVNANDKK
jgi:hypothetical protein